MRKERAQEKKRDTKRAKVTRARDTETRRCALQIALVLEGNLVLVDLTVCFGLSCRRSGEVGCNEQRNGVCFVGLQSSEPG